MIRSPAVRNQVEPENQSSGLRCLGNPSGDATHDCPLGRIGAARATETAKAFLWLSTLARYPDSPAIHAGKTRSDSVFYFGCRKIIPRQPPQWAGKLLIYL